MHYQNKADKLTIKNPKGNGCSHVYIAPNDLSYSSGLGQLFIIAEIKSKEKKVPAILDQIVRELSEYYYHSPTKNSEAALETACQYFNENIIEISQKNWQWLKERMNVLIATVQDNLLALSNYNGMRAWLVREGKVHDISGSESESKKAVTPKKIMSQIISGQLEKDDILMFSNAAIFDYFSEDKIKKTITTLAPTQACAFLKNTLLDYKVAADFSTIVVKIINPQKNSKETSEARPVNVLQGMEITSNLEQGREKPLAQTMKRTAEQIKNRFGQAWQQTKNFGQNKIVGKFKRVKGDGGEVTEPVIKDLPAKLGFNRGGLEGPKKLFGKLGAKEYKLVIFILIIALAFAGSLKIISNKRTQNSQVKRIEQVSAEIKDKVNSIEAALIYKDENKAQQLYQEAQGLMAEFDLKNDESKAAYNEASLSLEEIKNKIYHLEKVNKDTPFTSIPENVNVGSNASWIEGSLYFIGGENIYKISTKDGAVSQSGKVPSGFTKTTVFDNRQLVVYGNGAEIYFLDKGQGAAQKKTLSLPENDGLVDLAIYNKKIYLLGDKNIYSYNYNNGNYAAPSAWLKQETSVAGNNNIAVDGNVWLGATGGEISKFFKGKKESFGLSGLYEPISEGTRIYTTDSLNRLYLLDQTKNRVTIVDKQGKVLRQILGDNLDKIISVIPNDTEKELYIVTGKAVYKLAL